MWLISNVGTVVPGHRRYTQDRPPKLFSLRTPNNPREVPGLRPSEGPVSLTSADRPEQEVGCRGYRPAGGRTSGPDSTVEPKEGREVNLKKRNCHVSLTTAENRLSFQVAPVRHIHLSTLIRGRCADSLPPPSVTPTQGGGGHVSKQERVTGTERGREEERGRGRG